eukprot:TRINITY_DN3723_c0_g1_i2.p1 TRINITY_DN3723_c0_g1~~TRINITY_DN3723_c0_g1_i2.p1  ORF type:complete len:295 (-),score=-67.09 TRINITY_DN3723_c0_g1_i2:551-1435(-)
MLSFGPPLWFDKQLSHSGLRQVSGKCPQRSTTKGGGADQLPASEMRTCFTMENNSLYSLAVVFVAFKCRVDSHKQAIRTRPHLLSNNIKQRNFHCASRLCYLWPMAGEKAILRFLRSSFACLGQTLFSQQKHSQTSTVLRFLCLLTGGFPSHLCASPFHSQLNTSIQSNGGSSLTSGAQRLTSPASIPLTSVSLISPSLSLSIDIHFSTISFTIGCQLRASLERWFLFLLFLTSFIHFLSFLSFDHGIAALLSNRVDSRCDSSSHFPFRGVVFPRSQLGAFQFKQIKFESRGHF